MARAPVNVLVFPYRMIDGNVEFAVFNRADSVHNRNEDFWQGIAGGAEDNETPMEAAVRESWEEARIPRTCHYTQLDATCSVPASVFKGTGWGPEIYVVREYSFGVDIGDHEILLSEEHVDFRWLSLAAAAKIVKYQSNSVALGELHLRIQRKDL